LILRRLLRRLTAKHGFAYACGAGGGASRLRRLSIFIVGMLRKVSRAKPNSAADAQLPENFLVHTGGKCKIQTMFLSIHNRRRPPIDSKISL
jgi:hypothetical protein